MPTNTANLVRIVDTFERFFYRYSERNPTHFCMAATFDSKLDAEQLQTALNRVAERHPLLQSHIEELPDGGVGFFRTDDVKSVDLAAYDGGVEWRQVVADELSRPFDRTRAPLMRAVLINALAGSAVVLTFDHTVSDGISVVMIWRDLLAVVNGGTLSALPTPPSQESLIDRVLAGTMALAGLARTDPRMSVPTRNRPFAGDRPQVEMLALPRDFTSHLARRCRDEQTTVHAAIVTAASRVRGAERDEEFVRVVHAINFRTLIGVDDDCGDFFAVATTGMAPAQGNSFWDQARAVTCELNSARSAEGIVTGSRQLREMIPTAATTADAEQVFTAGLPFEMLISNLGVRDLAGSGPIRPAALWGPFVMGHVEGECMIGVVTYEGRLRMVVCGYSVTEHFLAGVEASLRTAAC